MKRLLALSLLVMSLLPATVLVAGTELEIQELSGSARAVTSQSPAAGPAAVSAPPALLPGFPSSTYPYYQTLKTFTFDNGALADPQLWTTHDLTVQDGVFWHVDDFAGLPAPYGPISGANSMWCGVRPGDVTDPAYAFAPGYGNRWTQILTSNEFSVIPNQAASIQYQLSFDLWGADRLDLEYKSATGVWTLLATYSGLDMSGALRSHNIPAAAVGGTLQFRFVVLTGQAGSDEDANPSDGAVILDEILVLAGGLSATDGFEGPTVGNTFSAYWTGSIPVPFGNYAGLVDGATVVQAGTPNTTHVWSFFNGSTDTYACGGYPQQAAVPRTAKPGSTWLTDYIVNEVRSPFIDLSVDAGNQPVNPDFTAFTAEFDVYADLDYNANTVVYTFRWRFMIGGEVQPWINRGILYFSATPQWIHLGPGDFAGSTIPAGATHVQIGIIAVDYAYTTGQTGQCSSQSPLIDNVTVHRLYPPVVVRNTNDSGFGSLRQAILSANANADMNTILFAIPGDGPHTIQPATPLPTINAPVWIDGFTQSGSAPNQYAFLASTAVLKVALDGSLLGGVGNGLFFGGGGYGVARGLAIGGFPEAGIRSETTSLILTGCYIGTDIWGTTANPNDNGIVVANQTTNIGGPANEERMVVAGNTTDGIVIAASSGPIFNTYVGVAADGSPMGNGQDGIHVTNGNGVQIGEPVYAPCVTGYTDRNRIAYNTRDGVRVENAVTNVSILNNRIYGNGALAVDLGGDGYTPPDALDADTGANGLQNRPTLTAADGTTITGSLNTEPNTLYRVEFFANSNCHSGGEEFIGYLEATTDVNGQAPFSFTCAPIPPATMITATVSTWPGPINTSEYSDCVLSTNTPPGAPLANLYDEANILRASVQYDYVVTGGNTYLSPTTPPAPVPSGFDVGPSPAYWDIMTTAGYQYNVHVSLHYDPNNLPGPENMLRVLHFENYQWVDITDDVDLANDRIGGTTTGLSPFVLAVPTGATGVGDTPVPSDFALHGNVPNPFNPVTTIAYDVPAGGADVNIAVFDVAGRLVRTLVNEHRGVGRFSVQWNGGDERGGRAATGVYFYRMKAGTFVDTKKMVLLK